MPTAMKSTRHLVESTSHLERSFERPVYAGFAYNSVSGSKELLTELQPPLTSTLYSCEAADRLSRTGFDEIQSPEDHQFGSRVRNESPPSWTSFKSYFTLLTSAWQSTTYHVNGYYRKAGGFKIHIDSVHLVIYLTVIGLLFMLVFGIGQWTVSNNGVDIAKWTACKDHPDIQNTTICEQLLNEGFDSIGRDRTTNPRLLDRDVSAAAISGDFPLEAREAEAEPLEVTDEEAEKARQRAHDEYCFISGHVGNANIYGLGIRISCYLLWVVVGFIRLIAPHKATSAIMVWNTITVTLTTAAFIAMCRNQPSDLVEVAQWWIVSCLVSLRTWDMVFDRLTLSGEKFLLWLYMVFISAMFTVVFVKRGRDVAETECDVRLFLVVTSISLKDSARHVFLPLIWISTLSSLFLGLGFGSRNPWIRAAMIRLQYAPAISRSDPYELVFWARYPWIRAAMIRLRYISMTFGLDPYHLAFWFRSLLRTGFGAFIILQIELTLKVNAIRCTAVPWTDSGQFVPLLMSVSVVLSLLLTTFMEILSDRLQGSNHLVRHMPLDSELAGLNEPNPNDSSGSSADPITLIAVAPRPPHVTHGAQQPDAVRSEPAAVLGFPSRGSGDTSALRTPHPPEENYNQELLIYV